LRENDYLDLHTLFSYRNIIKGADYPLSCDTDFLLKFPVNDKDYLKILQNLPMYERGYVCSLL
jgi:hypothetical protein